VGHLHPVAEHTVTGHVGAEIGPGGALPRMGIARGGYFQQRARLGVASAELLEVFGRPPGTARFRCSRTAKRNGR